MVFRMSRLLLPAILALCLALPPAQCANNPYGVHTLALPGGVFDWASSLTGPGGYCKLFFYGIDNGTSGPNSGWVNAVQAAYNRDMNVIVRIGTSMSDGVWQAPVADADGRYTGFASAVKRVVQGLPRQDGRTLYIEVLNEVNSHVEWSNDPDPAEYGRCLVDVHQAIASIGDSRIKVLPAGLAGGSDFLDQMFTLVPESLWAWDVLASHCYGMNQPPEVNQHNGAPPGSMSIDSYLDDLAVVAAHGRTGTKVMITETGYMLGDATVQGYPMIDEDNRADYVMRAFRDYWSKWPEVLAVTPFQFRDDNWQNFDWVYGGSGTDSHGRATSAHEQYYDVWNLAKPTMSRGAISGRISESAYGSALGGVTLVLQPGGRSTTSNASGNYFFPNFADPAFLDPGVYSVTASKTGYATQTATALAVAAGQNTVVNVALTATNLGTLTGAVRDPIAGIGLAGATITLSPGGRTAMTGADGRYTIASLTPATYTMNASKYGFRPYSLAGVTVSAGSIATLDFWLAPGLEPSGMNLISTGEMDTGANGLADGWEAWDGASHSNLYAIDTSERVSGRGSQRIRAGGDYWAGEWTNYGACTTGVTYRIEAWVKTSGTSAPARVTGLFSRWGEGTVSTFECYPQMTGTAGWTLFAGRAVAPYFVDQNNGRLRVELHPPASGSGYAWFDRVWVGRDSEPSSSPICSVADLRATPGEASATLSWVNPNSVAFPSFSGTMVRRMTDRYPVTSTEGTLVADLPSTASACTDTTAMPGVRYYYAAFAHAAGPSSFSKGSYASAVALDSSPPATPVVTDDGCYTAAAGAIHARWSSSDPESGIARYDYQVGTAPGAGNIVDWTSAGTDTERTIAATLSWGQTCYVSVRAVNGVGALSAVGSSDGITIAREMTIGAARSAPAGSAVLLSGAVVVSRAADWPGLWLESADRSSGISVPSSAPYPLGERVIVAGLTGWRDGVLELTAVEFKGNSAGPPLRSVCFTNRNLANDRTESLSYDGINPVGLLVAVWGRVTSVDEGAHVFYIDDGSNLADGTVASGVPNAGLRILVGSALALPQIGRYVRLSGIRTVHRELLDQVAFVNGQLRPAAETIYLPVIWMRDPSDLGPED